MGHREHLGLTSLPTDKRAATKGGDVHSRSLLPTQDLQGYSWDAASQKSFSRCVLVRQCLALCPLLPPSSASLNKKHYKVRFQFIHTIEFSSDLDAADEPNFWKAAV